MMKGFGPGTGLNALDALGVVIQRDTDIVLNGQGPHHRLRIERR